MKKYLKGEHRYKTGEKSVTFYIPISREQYFKLNQIHLNYCNKTPYDYAFLGMRCASATYDILSQIGVFKSKTQFFTILSTFYPKKLRKRMFKLAIKKNYFFIQKEGRNTRKWEND